jgi:hypothetical protein
MRASFVTSMAILHLKIEVCVSCAGVYRWGGWTLTNYLINGFSMYKNTMANIGIILIGCSLILSGTWLLRSQATVGDIAWMKAMISHHSIAVLTSKRAQIEDPRVRIS